MKIKLAALATYLLIALLILGARAAFAGEKYLGAIVSGAGADTTNESTAAPFVVPLGSKLTGYCTAAALICTDTASACTVLGGAQPGVPVAATTLFPTSVSPTRKASLTVTISGASSSILRIVGSGAVTCYWWAREGNE
jgi:hypothetical protein